MTTNYTVHGVLAGAYRGKALKERALLLHASTDESETSAERAGFTPSGKNRPMPWSSSGA